ncbi:hypothetical protein Hanom_Chr04g00348921 [Helianthus anomalus]
MFQPCWWVTAKSSQLRHEFDNLPICAHLAFEPFKKVNFMLGFCSIRQILHRVYNRLWFWIMMSIVAD